MKILFYKGAILVMLISTVACRTSQDKKNNTITTPKTEIGNDTPDILQSKDGWGKEIIVFPIDWAPKMNVKGYEDLRFAPAWSKPDHEQFWSLIMGWKINTTKELSLKTLHSNLEGYFDGLMIPNHWAQDFPKPTLEFFTYTKTEQGTKFKGKMTIFDGFHTGKTITLNILGAQKLCETTGKSVITFRFSPKEFSHQVWKELNGIIFLESACDY